MPKVSRFKVTIATGLLATVAAMFPAIAMKLLGFVALYGLLLMPMGAVVFVDFWLLKKLGMQSNYAEVSGKMFNWAAFFACALTLGICFIILNYVGKDYLFFVSLPGWFIAAVLYIGLSKIYQKKIRPTGQEV